MRLLVLALCSLAFAVPATAQPVEPDLKIDAAVRANVIEGSLAALNKYYVFPDVAAKIDLEIKKLATAKKYDALTSAKAFAETLTADLQAVSHDKHMRVLYSSESIPDRKPDARPPPADLERFRDQVTAYLAALRKVRAKIEPRKRPGMAKEIDDAIAKLEAASH